MSVWRPLARKCPNCRARTWTRLATGAYRCRTCGYTAPDRWSPLLRVLREEYR